MANNTLIAFDPATSLFHKFDAKIARRRNQVVSAGELAAIRTALGTPATADGLFTQQEIRDRVGHRTPDNGYSLDGVDDYLSIAHDAAMDLGAAQDFTVRIRGYLPAVPSAINSIATSRLGGTGYGFQIRTTSDGKIQGRLVGAGATVSPTDNSAVTAGEFSYQISCDRSANMVRYLNGIADGDPSDISSVGDLDDSSPIYIGKLNTEQFPGRIYSVEIIKRAVTAAEALTWHTRPGVEISDQWANTILSLQGRGAGVSRWMDESDNALHATVNGAALLFAPNQAETGVFTPSLSFDNNNTGITYSTQLGYWTRLAPKMVYVRGQLILTSKGAQTGDARIEDLPFSAPSNSQTPFIQCALRNTVGLSGEVKLEMQLSTQARFMEQGATDRTFLDETNFTNTTIILFSGLYETL